MLIFHQQNRNSNLRTTKVNRFLKYQISGSNMNDNVSPSMRQTTCLNLFVWLEPHQTADLVSTRVKDAGTHKVLRVGIYATQYPRPKAHQLNTQTHTITYYTMLQ